MCGFYILICAVSVYIYYFCNFLIRVLDVLDKQHTSILYAYFVHNLMFWIGSDFTR